MYDIKKCMIEFENMLDEKFTVDDTSLNEMFSTFGIENNIERIDKGTQTYNHSIITKKSKNIKALDENQDYIDLSLCLDTLSNFFTSIKLNRRNKKSAKKRNYKEKEIEMNEVEITGWLTKVENGKRLSDEEPIFKKINTNCNRL